MNNLLKEATELLNGQNFEYAICGGLAIDIFLGYESRTHVILIYWHIGMTVIQ
jgi:hypothetical protein